MAAAPPRILLRKPNADAPSAPTISDKPAASEGVQNQKPKPSEPSKARRSKNAPLGLKIVVRWLPPGMTEEEFKTILGAEWAVAGGKVNWLDYVQGKLSRNPTKSSTPSVAWLHLVDPGGFVTLAEHVKNSTWEDAHDTFNDPCLPSQAVLERAPHQRVPPATAKPDPLQGTIDQDPEFQAFLVELTRPVATKDASADDKPDDSEGEPQRMTTTPLIEYLREKRAKEEKAKSQAKAARAEAALKAKVAAAALAKEESQKRSRGERATGKGSEKAGEKAEKPKEPVRILKKGAGSAATAASSKDITTSTTTETKSTAPAAADPKSRRAGIAAAARILQRDLGIGPAQAHRRARQDISKTDKTEGEKKDEKREDAQETAAPPKPETKSRRARGRGDATEEEASAASSSTAQPTPPPPPPDRPQTPVSTASRSRGRGRNSKNADNSNKAPEAAKPAKAPQPQAPVVLLKRKPEKEMADEQNKAEEGSSSAAGRVISTATDASKKDVLASAAEPQKPLRGSTPIKEAKAPSAAPSGKKPHSITPGATQAFVKHVQASKGVTEEALRARMEEFGAVVSVEIEKRKGFAHVTFGEHQTLVDAVAASPIPIGQTSVLVAERKDKKGGGGGGSAARDAGHASAAGEGADKAMVVEEGKEPAKAPADSSSGKASTEKEKERDAKDKDKDRKPRNRRGRGGGGGRGTAGAGKDP